MPFAVRNQWKEGGGEEEVGHTTVFLFSDMQERGVLWACGQIGIYCFSGARLGAASGDAGAAIRVLGSKDDFMRNSG